MDALVWVGVLLVVGGLYLWGRRGGARRRKRPRNEPPPLALSEADAQRMVNDYRALLDRGLPGGTLRDVDDLPHAKDDLRTALEQALQRPFLDTGMRRELLHAYLSLSAFQPDAPAGLPLRPDASGTAEDGAWQGHAAYKRHMREHEALRRRLHDLEQPTEDIASVDTLHDPESQGR